MFLQHALFGLMGFVVLLHRGACKPAQDRISLESLEDSPISDQKLDEKTLAVIKSINDDPEVKKIVEYDNSDETVEAGDYEDAEEVDVGSLDSMEEVESLTPVKSIKEVKSIQEVKHISPIEEAVALAAIKKFRLKNQLAAGNGDEAEIEEEDDDEMERLKESEEEIEEELEKEHGMEELLAQQIAKEDVKRSAMEKVKHQHEKHARELEEQLEEIRGREQDIISAGGNVRQSSEELNEQATEESYEADELKEVESLHPIKSLQEIKSLKHIKDIQEVKSIEPVKSIQEVKHIYELTPTQARELKKLVEGSDNSENDYVVSAGHAKDD